MNVAAKPEQFGKNALPLITADQLAKDFAHVIEAVDELLSRGGDAPPVVEDDEDFEIVTGLISELGKYARRVDELRDQQKRPHLEAGNMIQSFFKGHESRLLTLRNALTERGTAYMKRKAEVARQAQLAEEAKARAAADAKAREAAEAMKAGETSTAVQAHVEAQALQGRANQAADAAAAKPADLARTATSAGTATLAQTWDFEIENIDIIDLEALRPFLPRATVEQAMRAFVKSGRREIRGARIFPKTSGRWRG